MCCNSFMRSMKWNWFSLVNTWRAINVNVANRYTNGILGPQTYLSMKPQSERSSSRGVASSNIVVCFEFAMRNRRHDVRVQSHPELIDRIHRLRYDEWIWREFLTRCTWEARVPHIILSDQSGVYTHQSVWLLCEECYVSMRESWIDQWRTLQF